MPTMDSLVETFARQHIKANATELINVLARSSVTGHAELLQLQSKAVALTEPVLDYVGAAEDAGWVRITDAWTKACDDDSAIDPIFNKAEDACDFDGIEPYKQPVYELWIVSEALAIALKRQSERVEIDFGGLAIWARTATGQSITLDPVIGKLALESKI